MTTVIENSVYNTGVFSTSEEYFALRAFWRAFIAQGKHKPVPEPMYTWGEKEPVGYHRVSPLKFEHHLIYLVATGKSLEAYSNTTAEAKWRVFVNISPQHFTLFDETVPKEHQDTILRTIRNWCRGN